MMNFIYLNTSNISWLTLLKDYCKIYFIIDKLKIDLIKTCFVLIILYLYKEKYSK
jgi:hypothetical protein